MVCARCGTTFEGRFCPKCGTPASGPASVPGPAGSPPPTYFRCGRCGTTFSGKFCPTCGLAAWSPWIPPSPPPRTGGYTLLNVAWIFSLIAFLAVLAIATVGMFAMTPTIGRGIGDIREGGTTDRGFDSPGAWTFHPWSVVGATGSQVPFGGNPGGYGEIRLEGRPNFLVSGYWYQSFRTEGSHPFRAQLRFDYRVFQTSDLLGNVTIRVYVDKSAGDPPPNSHLWEVVLAQPTNWTRVESTDASTGETVGFIDLSSVITENGTYYLRIAALAFNRAGVPGTPTVVGFDNVRVAWATNAFIEVFVVTPVPILLYETQSPTAFYLWTAALLGATVLCLGLLILRDRRTLVHDLKTGSEHMPAKLRSRSVTIAIMQTFLAATFFSILVGILSAPPEPTFFSTIPEWYLLFSLLNAPVYEELIFRALMIGVPLMAGSLYFRASNVVRGRLPRGTMKGRYLAGSLRYVVGGGMSRKASRAVLLPASLFLVLSSVIFGLAHAPGYGDWKVLPAIVAALAMGYLFLRHGLYASILFHFATDVFIATFLWAGQNSALGIAMNLGFLGLMIPGAGFFAYYLLYIARLTQDVFRPRVPGTPSAAGASPLGAAAPMGVAWGPYAQGYGPGVPPAGVPPTPMPVGYAPATRPPGYGTSPVEYRCPRCAWVEAAYENGRFRCLRCGHVG